MNINEDSIEAIESKSNKSSGEIELLKILREDTADKLADTSILNNVHKIGFQKVELSPDKFDQLNQIFCERKHEAIIDIACVATYRDILLFRYNNKIIGTAKICFECKRNIIAGTTLNTSKFGQSGDYEQLHRLLY